MTRSAWLVVALLAAGPVLVRGQPVNPMHPSFTPLDAAGKPAVRAEQVSADLTCGACHDTGFIAAHSQHGRAGVQASCIHCHVEGGRLEVSTQPDGKLRREDLRIGRPGVARCASCHGVTADGSAPVLLPPDFEVATEPGRRIGSLTMAEGAIFSPQPMSESFLELEGKAGLQAPWDVHAARLVDCASCHHARNDPRRADLKQTALKHLGVDPRRPSTAEFLHRPDHELARPDCRSCHAALAVHGFLPYRERHLQVLACQACHAPGPVAPAAQSIDATVATAAGTPAHVYRNAEPAQGEPLNAVTVRPLRPLLVLRTEPDGARRLAPVNVIGRWRWVSGPERREVPFPTVVQAFRDGGRWAPEVLAALDGDRDGQLSSLELRLDAAPKVAAVRERLRALGVEDPEIDGVLEPHALAHGIAGRDRAVRACDECHGDRSRLSGDFTIAAYLPGGVPPRPPDDGGRTELSGSLVASAGGGLLFRRDAVPGLHVLGRSHQASDLAGFLVFALVFTGVAVHGSARLILRRRLPRPSAEPRRRSERVFGLYQRIWHWTMALSGIGLIATGFVLHGGGPAWPLDLPAAVAAHNALALVLVVNAMLSLFYHVTTAAIRSFLPAPRGLLARILEHLDYQMRGIFRGAHPRLPPGETLNPLQQLTYLALLNVLFPLQIGTGVLVWAVGHWPSVATAVGGLSVIAPLHSFGAWLFLSFFTLHVYLVTTGRTVGEHLRAMVTGERLVDPDPQQGV